MKMSAAILFVALMALFPIGLKAATVGDISQQLMCSCGCGLVLATCHCDLPDGAAEMTALIEQKLAQGQSEQEIITFFVDRYGQQVLAPPKQNANPVLWSVALMGLLTVGTVIYLKQKKRTKKPARRK